MDVTIDLDESARPAPARPRPVAGRFGALLLLAVVAGAPQAAPVMRSSARAIPPPSYCSGLPIPGGRLNIIEGSKYIILDATTGTIVGQGVCFGKR